MLNKLKCGYSPKLSDSDTMSVQKICLYAPLFPTNHKFIVVWMCVNPLLAKFILKTAVQNLGASKSRTMLVTLAL